MKLTIGMILKNEEKYIGRCLSAIKPILDNVDSELIVTDTGSTDGTIDIVRRFTDKIYRFEWADDFSAARNSGLEKAQGEWFMYLDADDIFRSCDGIIDFFNSGEYKNYNAATYVSRNIFNTDDPNDWSDQLAPRMVKLLPETKFVNIIHEALNTFAPPFRYISDIADHYGYAYGNGENMLEKKFERNSVLLLKQLETEGDTNEMLYVYLFECYSAVFDLDRAYSYLKQGEELCKKNKSIVLTVIYAHRARLAFRNRNYEEAIHCCDIYFGMDTAIRPHTLTTDAEMLYLRAVSYDTIDMPDKAAADFRALFDIYDDVLSGKLATRDAYLQAYEFATERNFIPAFCEFLQCCVKSGHNETAERYIVSVPAIRHCRDKGSRMLLAGTIAKISELSGSGSVRRYYDTLDDEAKSLFVFFLFAALYKSEDNAGIVSGLESVAAADEKIADKLILYRKFSDGDITQADIVSFTERYGIKDDPDLLCIAICMGFDIASLFRAGSEDLIMCVYMCCTYIEGFFNAAAGYDPRSIAVIDALPQAAKIYELIIKCLPETVKIPSGILTAYAQIGRMYAAGRGTKNMPESICYAYLISECDDLFRAKKYKEFFTQMKNVVTAAPKTAPMISCYRRLAEEEIAAQ